MSALRVNGQRVAGFGIFGVMIWMLFLRFIVPVLGVFYGTALMADEVEDKTITYLFTRPIPRGAVLVGKYLAYLACTFLVVLPSVMIVYFLLVPFVAAAGHLRQPADRPGPAGAGPGRLRRRVRVRRRVLQAAAGDRPGLRLRLGAGRLALPGYLKRFTIAYYLQALVPHAMPSDGVASILQGMFRENPAGLASAWHGFSHIWAVFCIWRPGWSSARNTCWSSRAPAGRRTNALGSRRNLGPPGHPYNCL